MARRKKAADVSPENRALLDELVAQQRRTMEILASTPRMTNAEIIARLIAAGLPADKAEKLQANLDWKPGYQKREEHAAALIEKISQLNAAGLNDGKIASELGLCRPYVCKLRRANGIPAAKRRT